MTFKCANLKNSAFEAGAHSRTVHGCDSLHSQLQNGSHQRLLELVKALLANRQKRLRSALKGNIAAGQVPAADKLQSRFVLLQMNRA